MIPVYLVTGNEKYYKLNMNGLNMESFLLLLSVCFYCYKPCVVLLIQNGKESDKMIGVYSLNLLEYWVNSVRFTVCELTGVWLTGIWLTDGWLAGVWLADCLFCFFEIIKISTSKILDVIF